MPISRARTVAVVMQKKRKPAPPPAGGGGGELMAVQEPTQGEPIPTVELFGHKFDLCSRWTWERLLQPIIEKVTA